MSMVATQQKDLLDRIAYVCHFYFHGDVARFARTINFDKRQLSSCLTGRSAVTIKLLADIISCTSVCAEWLLCGRGPISNPGVNSVDVDSAVADRVPGTLDTQYPLFCFGNAAHISDLWAYSSPAESPAYAEPEKPAALNDFDRQTWYAETANLLRQSVANAADIFVFAGEATFYNHRAILHKFLSSGVVHSLVLTGEVLEKEVSRAGKINYSAAIRLGADSGLGIGETVQQWGCVSRESILLLARNKHVPVFGIPTLGESPTDSSIRGNVDFGAAVGMTAQIDISAFTQKLYTRMSRNNFLFIFLAGSDCLLKPAATSFGVAASAAARNAGTAAKDYKFSALLATYDGSYGIAQELTRHLGTCVNCAPCWPAQNTVHVLDLCNSICVKD